MQAKKLLGVVGTAMNTNTNRRMYTERTPRSINIYAMNNTTQELSKRERQTLANKRYYEKNKRKRHEAAKEYYLKNKEKNKEKVNQYLKLYREKNRKKIQEGARASYQRYREKRLKEVQAYEQRPDVKQKINNRIKQRRLTEPNFKLSRILRNQLYQHLKLNKTKKSKSALQLVGCSISELKEYIERQWLPGMTWENYTTTGWHVDHIKPVNTFDLTDIEQQKLCFHYTNLRPLWAADNLSRPDDGSDILTIPTQAQ